MPDTRVVFKSYQSDLLSENGPATLLREISSDEFDSHDVGPMWEIITHSGKILWAFQDELEF